MRLGQKVLLSVEIILICGLLAVVYVPAVDRIPFTPDESDWISTSQFWEAFITGEFPEGAWHGVWGWDMTVWTLTQPPVTRYIVGIGRSLGGYSVSELTFPWSWAHTVEQNRELGNYPSDGLLHAARMPMAILNVVSGMILFVLLRFASGRLTAYLAAGSLLINPYFLDTLSHAWTEPSLMFFTCIALLMLFIGLTRLEQEDAEKLVARNGFSPAFGWLVLSGVFIGLAGASKINGMLAAGGLALVALLGYLLRKRELAARFRRAFGLRSALLIIFAAYGVFILVNPFLYPDPLINTGLMYKFRLHEMNVQMAGFPEAVIDTPLERVRVLVERVFQDTQVLHFKGAWMVNLPLALMGAYEACRTLRNWIRGCTTPGGAAAAVLLMGPLPVALAALATPLDWIRYYLFPALLVTALIAVGINGLARRLLERQFTGSLRLVRELVIPEGHG